MKQRQAGFTMVEVLVAVAVTTVMVLVITNFMMRNVQTSTIETTQATIVREVEQTLDEVNADIRVSANADQINRNADANSPLGGITGYGWTASNTVLILATAATDSNGNIIFSDPTNYVTTKNNLVYFVSGGTLYRRTIAANASNNAQQTTCPANKVTASCPGDKALLHNVTAWNVTYLDGDSNATTANNARAIELSLTAAYSQYNQTQKASYTTRMVFRND